MTLALNMIVRNESGRIERCLNSIVDHIVAAVIVDTGSTDETVRLMEQTFASANIPYRIYRRPFINFMQARNVALDCARSSDLKFDNILLTDADMELVVEDPKCFDNLTGPSYDIIQKAGALSYHNRRIVSRNTTGGYRGVTHEYLDLPSAGCLAGVHFVDHADGSNRADKFGRDIALLLADLRSDPANARSWFYLAQSYRDNGQPAQAAQAYRRRIELGGWEEEVFDARMNYATALKDLGDEGGYVRELLMAYNYRPSRGESLYDLSKYFREKGDNHSSLLFSERGMKLPVPNDLLFVNQFVHTTGLKEEFSICAFYDPTKRDRGFQVTNEIALDRGAPEWSRELAKRNTYYYLEPLLKYAPSFKAQPIGFTPPDDYIAMNPSIANIDDKLMAIVRTVNYTIDKDGRYLIRSTSGEANGTNPIDTRNFVVQIDDNLSMFDSAEVIWNRAPALFPPVIGLEDMRLFERDGALAFSACVREQNSEGWCEQYTGAMEYDDGNNEWLVSDAKPMLPEKRENEKNWMPFPRRGWIDFVHRLGTVADSGGNTLIHNTPSLATDTISGSSQVIPFAGAFLAVVHESRYLPNEPHKRYYQHRFALMDEDGRLHKLSLPFVLHAKQIEFVAGLCWHPDRQRLLISYGVRDEEAWIAEVDWHEVMGMLV